MGRKDWDYITIPVEMAAALDEIIRRNGRRYGIYDKAQLIRQLTGDFITKYDVDNSIPEARKYVEERYLWTSKKEKTIGVYGGNPDLDLNKYQQADEQEKKATSDKEKRNMGRGKITSIGEPEEIATYNENDNETNDT